MKLTVTKTVQAMAKIIARSDVKPIGTISDYSIPRGNITIFIPTGKVSNQLTTPSGR